MLYTKSIISSNYMMVMDISHFYMALVVKHTLDSTSIGKIEKLT